MDSEYGFIGQIKYEDDGTMYLQTHAITNIAWNQATRDFYKDNAESGLKFYNLNTLFGHVMVHAEPVIANTPSKGSRACGIPDGHPPLNHFLGIPFFESGGVTMNGMVGIANKPGGYTREDIEFLEPFTVTCSNLIQAYSAMQENIRLIDTLEEKVKERTCELEMVNVRLESANRRVVEASAAQLKNFACMSHEIRTPLNCIVGLSSLLLETNLTPQQNDSMRMIVNSGELLSAVVNDVLDYSKLLSDNMDIDIQPTDLQNILDVVVYSIEVKAHDQKLQLRTNYDPLVPKIIDTDGRRIQQILYNLLGNSIKFSKSNGIVEFSLKIVETMEQSPEEAHVFAEEQEGMPTHQSAAQGECLAPKPEQSSCPFHRTQTNAPSTVHGIVAKKSKVSRFLRFIVKDYGKGIDSADFDKIFKPFMQASGETEKIYGGTGLGLAITSKLVEALGGRISVDSMLGEWSEFTVDLPFAGEMADTTALSQLLSDTRIMVVKEQETLGLSPSLVQTYKLNVTEFESCAELKTFATVKGAIDLKRNYLCLIHEDLYDRNDLSVFAAAAPGTTLLTFGPKYSIKDKFSRGQYRSIDHILPSALVSSLHQSMTKSSMTSDTKEQLHEESRDVGKYATVKILIAEDNVVNQKVLKNILKRFGIQEVDVVNNGLEAVKSAATGDYDLILMDMQMPVVDGIEATRLILQQDHDPKVPKIIFVTANALGSIEGQIRETGAVGFIPKPFNVKKIQRFLDSFLSGNDDFFR